MVSPGRFLLHAPGTASADDSDDALISAVQAGDPDAYGYLWQRHYASARGVARSVTRPDKADDLVADAFARVLALLRRGKGPGTNFRAYLLTTLRSINVDNARAYEMRVTPCGLADSMDSTLPPSIDHDGTDGQTALRAWASLSEQDRRVLWASLVEERPLAEIAAAAGCTKAQLSVKTLRARERLREAFLYEHLAMADTLECRTNQRRMPAYVRGSLAKTKRAALAAHLDECGRCRAAILEISCVNFAMKVILGPILLGAGAVGLSSVHGGASKQSGRSSSVHAAGRMLRAVSDVIRRHSTRVALVGTAALVAVALVMTHVAGRNSAPTAPQAIAILDHSNPPSAAPSPSSSAAAAAAAPNGGGSANFAPPAGFSPVIIALPPRPAVPAADPTSAAPTSAPTPPLMVAHVRAHLPVSSAPTPGPTPTPTATPATTPATTSGTVRFVVTVSGNTDAGTEVATLPAGWSASNAIGPDGAPGTIDGLAITYAVPPLTAGTYNFSLAAVGPANSNAMMALSYTEGGHTVYGSVPLPN